MIFFPRFGFWASKKKVRQARTSLRGFWRWHIDVFYVILAFTVDLGAWGLGASLFLRSGAFALQVGPCFFDITVGY